MKFGDNYRGEPPELKDVPLVDCVAFKVWNLDRKWISPFWCPFRHYAEENLEPYPDLANQELETNVE